MVRLAGNEISRFASDEEVEEAKKIFKEKQEQKIKNSLGENI